MNPAWRTSRKWLFALVTAVASTAALYILFLGLAPLADRSIFALLSCTHLNVPPTLLFHLADHLSLAALTLLWIIPIALAVGYAIGTRWLPRLQWALFSALLPLACFLWLLDRRNHVAGALTAALIAVSLLIAERIASARHHLRADPALAIQSIALLILFVPAFIQLARAPRLPPVPKQLWSVVLQPGTWQAMNTGSEFESTRQLVFAGDRIVAVFDAGFAPHQGKQPMSRYRIVSLDRTTGAIKKQTEIVGRWGAMPLLLPNSDGNIVLANGPLQLLNPNLEPVGAPLPIDHGRVSTISPDGTTLAWELDPGTTLFDANTFKPLVTLSVSAPSSISPDAVLNDNMSWPLKYPNDHEFITRTDANGSKLIDHAACGYRPPFLSSNRILVTGCGAIRILNNDGATIATRQDTEDAYIFAGVNQQGTRFALEMSEGEGDPSTLLYEYFYIYDANTAAPIATIPVTNLPARQSWSAFSPDGKLFAIGNPNNLTLYQLP